jgi:methionyl aminopeptidase
VDDRNRKLTRDGIRIHDAADFDGMRRAGRLAAETLDMIADHVQPGVTTEALDQLCDRFMRDHGAVPATLGYKGYPKSSCISINHVVCHGIPGPKRLKEGDILNIDVTCILDGWYGDTSRMFVAGRLLRRAERLIEVTHDALMAGIAAVRPGNRFGDIGAAIQAHVEENRMSVVRDFCGHGLGRVFHAPPNVLHFGRPGTGRGAGGGDVLYHRADGQSGRPETKVLADDWTAVTKDRSLSAQFEHSVGVTAAGCEVFTLSPAGRFHPTWD